MNQKKVENKVNMFAKSKDKEQRKLARQFAKGNPEAIAAVENMVLEDNRKNLEYMKEIYEKKAPAYIIAKLEDKYNKEIEEYAEKLKKSPRHTLSWGESLFKAAAIIELINTIKYVLFDENGSLRIQTKEDWKEFKDRIGKEALSDASSSSCSTSQCSNLMDRYIVAVKASFATRYFSAFNDIDYWYNIKEKIENFDETA